MMKCIIAFAGLIIGGIAAADNLEKVDKLLCSTGRLLICFEETGRLTVAVSRNGLSVTVFGACTDADI